MRTVVPILLTIVAVLSIFFLVKKTQHSEVHLHAGFQIYIDGKLQDFSNSKYMSLVPCSDDTHKNKTQEKVHLHDGVGDVVHVHIDRVVWKDLVDYLKVNIEGKQFNAFVNGKETPDVLNKHIEAYDSLVLLIGKYDKDTKKYLDKSPTVKYIKDVETRNGLCKG